MSTLIVTNPRKRGVALILTAISLVVISGMIGLAVDMGILYFVKAQLSQALDAAALSGARSLSRGTSISLQDASAKTVATNYLNANFPKTGFWGCTRLDPVIAVSQDVTTRVSTVSVTATASAPLYFLRVLGKHTATVGTTAVAKRRDANIMIVLDRSGSMSTAMNDLVTSADWFVGQFAPGRDKVGLVTFGTTYNLIKPTTTFSPSVVTAINTLKGHAGGATNHAQALWVAYQALAEADEPGALNVILFFTDGEPNTITADFSGVYRKKPTTCDNTNAPMVGNAVGDSMIGFYGTIMNPPYQPGSTSAGTARTAFVSTAYDTDDKGPNELISLSKFGTNYSGCQFKSNSSNFINDITQIPQSDIYGNQTNPLKAYKSVTLTTKDSTNFTNAAFNAGLHAAQRMRSGPGQLPASPPIVPLLDCISLVTSGKAIDATYMRRLANTVDSGSGVYDATKPTGIYVSAATTADLQGAFVQIASQILHLSN